MALSDSVVFRLNTLPSKLFGIFQSMRRNGECCDITIKFGNSCISAHRIILFAAFPCIKDMFGNQVVGSKELTDLDIEPSALESLIDFAYSCELEISSDNVEDLLAAALHLKSHEVRDACCEFLFKRTNARNAMKRLEFAENLFCSALIANCEKFIKENFDEVASTEGFLNAPLSAIKRLISADDLTTSGEEKVFEAVINWMKRCPNDRLKHLPGLLSCVRLILIDPQYLRDRIAIEEDVRKSLPCRDLLDDVKYYHLLPERRAELSALVTRPRKKRRLNPEINGSQNKARGAYICAVSKQISLRVQQLDLGANEWKTLETVPFEVGTGTTVSASDTIYFVDTESLRSRTIQNSRWNSNASFMSDRSYACTAVLNKKLYVCGGKDGRQYLNTVVCFDLEKNEYSIVPCMHEKRLLPGVVALEQYLYVFGGHSGLAALRSVEKYDPDNRFWTILSPMNMDRYGMGCCAFDGKIYACGGKSSSLNEILSSAEVYDPLKNQWKYISPMKKQRVHCSLVSDGRNIYAIGGCGENLLVLNSVEIYDTHTDQWEVGPNMDPTQRYVRAVSVELPAG